MYMRGGHCPRDDARGEGGRVGGQRSSSAGVGGGGGGGGWGLEAGGRGV